MSRLENEIKKVVKSNVPEPIWNTVRTLNRRRKLSEKNLVGVYPITKSHTIGGVMVQMRIPNETQAMRVADLVGEEEYIKEILSSITPTDVYYDIGASIGTHSLPTAKKAKYVFAFEPDPSAVEELVFNSRLNNFCNFTVIPIALSDRPGSIELSTSGLEGMAPTTRATNGNPWTYEKQITVTTKRIDDLVSSGQIPEPDVLKIDVEGAELLVLNGLGNLRPREIFIESHQQYGSPSVLVRQKMYEMGGYIEASTRERGQQTLLHFQNDR